MIGGRIRRLRGTPSQLQFARRLGISREQLSRIESGAQVPRTETLRRLAQVTGVSLDFLVLGTAPAFREAAAAGAAWETAVESLLAGTSLRLPRVSATAGRRAERAWQELPEERREEIRAFVRQLALIAAAIEALLPTRAAKAVTSELGAALATVLVDRIVAATGRSIS